ncbi:MAG TPA: hypothetical protein VF210_03900 [Pseudomonadales bacterium]
MSAPRRLRAGLCAVTLQDLPEDSSGPRGELIEQLHRVREAGIEALQSHRPNVLELAQRAGLQATGLARVDKPEHARAVARRGRELGCDCTTLHVGSGFESDDEARALIEAIVEASDAEGHPLYVETHRATLTQDMKRTLDLVAWVPEVRFNGDFSQWYTGLEMSYGDLEDKFMRLAPVLERVRFLHARVSSPGCIQIPVDGEARAPHVEVFERFWTHSFLGYLADPGADETIGVYPELLPAAFHYARLVPGPDGKLREETDRWQQALRLIDLARRWWERAVAASSGRAAGA